MRLRKKPGTLAKLLLEQEYYISDPKSHFGKWQQQFPKAQPIVLEIGMGGGQFLSSLAVQNPGLNYLGIEKQEELLVYAIQKAKVHALRNLKVLWYHAEHLTEIFTENEISHLHLNFSDPWPKAKHAKRRLTAQLFLQQYQQILKPMGSLEFRTDNQALFAFSLVELEKAGWFIERTTEDLHSENYFTGMMTEYEARFQQQGTKIYSLLARNGKQ